MKLQYHILWFEDQPDWIKTQMRTIRRVLGDLGFSLFLESEENATSARVDDWILKLSNHNKFDLIILDYDLGNTNKSGTEIAAKLRKMMCSDIILYTGHDDPEKLWNEINEHHIDGVYVLDRIGFPDRIEEFLKEHIKKQCGMNVMRGLLMDEFSTIESRIRSITRNFVAALPPHDEIKFLKDRKKKYKKSSTSSVAQVDRLTSSTDMFHDDFRPAHTDFVRRSITKLLPEKHRSKVDNDSLLKSMQDMRNKLAHSTLEESEDGRLSILGSEDVFDYDRFIEIRKNLIKISRDITVLEKNQPDAIVVTDPAT